MLETALENGLELSHDCKMGVSTIFATHERATDGHHFNINVAHARKIVDC